MGIIHGRHVRAALAAAAKPLLFAIVLTLLAGAILWRTDGGSGILADALLRDAPRPISRALVVASTSNLQPDDVAWLDDLPREWQGALYHYVTDKPLSPDVAVPMNKGNEAMAYMTYIIDHYDALADVVVFHHAHRRSWHQTMDAIDEVRRLRVAHVLRTGYVSLRCLPGCENVMTLADDAVDPQQLQGQSRAVQLTALLGDFLDKDQGERVPVRLAAPCCAQFAASRAAIQQRPRAWWVSLRQWLIDTPLISIDSGRLMEYTWHIWLGQESVLCPDLVACQCHVFGIGQCDEYFALEATM